MNNFKANNQDQAIRPPEAPRPSNIYSHRTVKDSSAAYVNRRTLKRDGIIPTSVSLAVKEELRGRLVLGWNSKSAISTPINNSAALISSNRVMPANDVIGDAFTPKFPIKSRDQKKIIEQSDSSFVNGKMLFNEGISEGGSIFTAPKGYGEEQFEISDKNEKHFTDRVAAGNPWWSISATSSIINEHHQPTLGTVLPQRSGLNNNKTRRQSRDRSLISRGANEIGNMVGPFLTAISSLSRPNTTSLRPSQLDLSQMYYGSVMSSMEHNDNSLVLPLITSAATLTYDNSSIASTKEKSDPLKTTGIEILATAISAKGGAEFCYLQPSIDNVYTFSVRDTVPETISRNDFVTLGKEGILRSTEVGGSEFIHHSAFQRDHDNYCKLRTLKLFGKYSLWKPLRAWRCYVIARKRRLVVMFLYNVSALIVMLPSFCYHTLDCNIECKTIQTRQLLSIFTISSCRFQYPLKQAAAPDAQ
jgi:hypothetical protein